MSLDNTRKSRPKTFVVPETANFWNVFFYRPLRSQRNDLIICTIIVKKPCGPLWIVPWGLLHSIIREKPGQNLLSPERLPFSSKICVFNNLLGSKELILQLAQYLSDYTVVFRGRVFHGVFSKGRKFCFCSFFRLKSSNCFLVETVVFERSCIFCKFCW